MASQLRVWKVLLALLVSMTLGAIILMILGNNPPSAGAFCLSTYYRLDSADKAVLSRTTPPLDRWKRIEIYYSGTRVGNIELLTSLEGQTSTKDINCHFVVCNGSGGQDGEIQSTERWQNQQPIRPSQNWFGPDETIRICVVADGKTAYPTDFQVKRVEALVETLCRKFNIPQQNVYYPGDVDPLVY